jgi:predicted Ser/Thr protein kinase
MVTNSNDVYIIDYDMAKLAKNDELNNMRMFNYSYSKGVASANLVFYVYNKLVSDKIIV